MYNLIIFGFIFLFTEFTYADIKDHEKAKFDVISSIEQLVNVDECRKEVMANKDNLEDLPRPCNSLPSLSKYFFSKTADLNEVLRYLDNEEGRVSEKAMALVKNFKINSLGKMMLSDRCVINNRPVDLDVYLDRLKGVSVPADKNEATELEAKFEESIDNSKHGKVQLIPMEKPVFDDKRNPARSPDSAESEIKAAPAVGEFQKEFAVFDESAN